MYVGEVIHQGRYYPGEHDAIVDRGLFEAVQQELAAKARTTGLHRIAGSLLTGRIFDDRGNRMTPTTAKKGAARYRYYTSCVLSQGRREMAGSVPRVPAPEIESLVLETLRASGTGLDADRETPEEVDSGSVFDQVDQIVIRRGSVEIRHVQPEGSGPQSPIVVPWAPVPSRRKRSITVPVGPGIDARPIRAETRARLVEGIAKARCWVDELVAGRVTDTAQIAQREGCSERSVRMTLNLAFLSPAIMRAAVEGTLPRTAGIARLVGAPMSWTGQVSLLLMDARHRRAG